MNLAVWAQTAVQIQPPNLAGPVAGSLNGQAGVSASGASTYSVSLALPPGTAGMAPTLSLDYSSQSGMSSLGFGWKLDGLSQITRCPKTIVQDGVRRGIALTAEDQFCLDGQRLLMVPGSGTHGAAAEYRTQIDGQSKVQSFGSDPATGPSYFEVRNKKGLVFTYGKTVDATIEAQGTGRPVLTWALSRVMDLRGNYYDVRYTETNTATLGETYPERVLYTGHAAQGGNDTSLAPYNAVRFIYEDRPDLQLGFVAGSRLTTSKRMTAVRAYIGTDADGNGGTLVREYRIAYVLNAINGRSLVDRISDCDGNGVCLPPTTFAWTQPTDAGPTAGSGNWGGPSVSITSYPQDGDKSAQVKAQVSMGDFNGDGVMDLIRGDGSGSWQVCLSTGTGFNCQNWAGPAALTRDALTGDFNGDGKTDLAVYPRADGPGNWTVCLSTGSGFNCSQWAGYGALTYYGQGQTLGGIVGDFNGDGRDDIALASASTGDERICRSVGNGFEGGTCQPYPGSYTFMYASVLGTDENHQFFQTGQMSGDIDGDGRSDIIYYAGHRSDPKIYPQGGWGGIRATDTGFVSFSAASTGQVMLDGVTSPGNTRFIDVTADPYGSLSDVVNGYISDGTNPARMEICRSTGVTLSCLALPGAGAATGPVTVVRDLDGDGRPDVGVFGGAICQLNLAAYGANNADQYTLSCSSQSDRMPAAPQNSLVGYVGDFNGDGEVDNASYVMVTNTTGYWQVGLSKRHGFVDLLDTATNGVGQAIRFAYARQSDPAVYTFGAAVSYPKRNLVGGGAPLVKSMLTGNGMGGWLTTDYEYEGARTDLSGRGALGFEKRRVIDRIKNITTQTTVSQDFPTTGMPLETRSTQANGTVLSLSTIMYNSLSTTAGAVCPYAKSSTLQTRDLNGTAISTTTSGVNSGGIDAYCNVTDTTETVGTSDGASFSTRTVTSYLNNTSAWLIGLPTNSAVTKTAVQPYAQASSLALVSCSASTPSTSAATFTCTLANRGSLAASGIAYASGIGTTATGPSSCAAASNNCGAVVVTTSGAPGAYSGQLRATPGSSGAAATANYSLTVTQPPVLALSQCASSAPSMSAATFSCRLSNSSVTAANGVSYAAGSGATASGPASCAGSTADCGTVTVTTSASPGAYNGSLSATPTNGGSSATASYSLTVNTAPLLALVSCGSSSPSTSAGAMSCTLTNAGQTAATSIAYAAGSGVSVAGPASCAAGSANCGTVTVTTAGTPSVYGGTLAATPTPSGGTASASYSLTVYTPPALTLTNCNSSAASTAAATMSCTLGNTGQVTASGIAYGAGSGASTSGPTSCAAGTANCGTVTVTTSATAGSYTGSLTASPGNGGGGASAAYSLTVYTPPGLGLTNCSSSAASMSVASMSCTLANNGQTAASGITYGTGSGTTAGGPTSCAANTANCGSVTVTTSTTPGTYSGMLSAAPANGGSGATASYSLKVNTAPALALVSCSSSSPSTSAGTLNCRLSNSGQTAASSVTYAAGSGVSINGPSSCAASASDCGAVTVTTSGTPNVYSGTLTATPSPAGGAGSAGYSLTVYKPPALTLSGCVSSAPSTSAATMSCTLGNTGQTAASGIGYGTGAGASAGGPTSCAANTGNCGTVTLTSSGSAGNYAGTLTATPGNGGSGASAGYSLAVYTPPALGLVNCSSTAPSVSAGGMSCTLTNSGQTAATGVAYGAGSGVLVGGPSNCAAGSGNCGTVTVTTSSNPGTYAGTLSASPTNGGSGASAGYSLTVLTPPALRLAGCSSTSPSTAVQTMTCTLANDGQSGTSIGYGSGSGTSASGPTSCAGSNGNCGTVTLTTSPTPGGYGGTLTVSALSGGSGTSTSYFLRVYSNGTTLSASPMSLDWGTLTGGSPTLSMTIQNTGLAPTTLSWGLAYTAGSIGMGNYSVVAAQSTCTSGQSLDIGQACTVTWAMNTQCTTKGRRSANMTLNGGTSQVVVSLTANVQRTTLCQ